LFGYGRTIPLDRNAKARVMAYARALMRRTEKGRHYGDVTAKAAQVCEALSLGTETRKSVHLTTQLNHHLLDFRVER
jgi:hypothetical protein